MKQESKKNTFTNMRSNTFKISKFYLVPCALILMYAGFYNGYPLVTSDTGTYINSGFTLTVPDDRPISYGLLIRFFSMGFSLWLPLLLQNLIVSFVIVEFIRLANTGITKRYFLLIFVLLTYFSGISWFSSQIMPDIFSALPILVFPILLLGRSISIVKTLALCLILGISLIVHVSNLFSFLLLFLLWCIILFFKRKNWKNELSVKRHALIGFILIGCWGILPGIHLIFSGQYKISNSSHVFLTARLVENGILDYYLKQNCATNKYKICGYKDQLPDNTISFIWDQNSPLYKTGGWEANREEYENIIANTISTPTYLLWHVYEGVLATLRQLTHNNIGDGLFPYLTDTNPFWKIQEFFPYEFKEYTSSLQNKGNLNFDSVNKRYNFIIILSLIAIFAFLRLNIKNNTRLLIVITCLLGIFCNAAISATLGNVLDRLQARTIWILPLLAMVILPDIWLELIKVIRNNYFQKSIVPPLNH